MASTISPAAREFTWSRDPDGYRLLETSERVVRSGKRLETYKPLELHENLFGEFASIRQTADGVLNFVKKFGPLTLEGTHSAEGEEVAAVIEAAQTISRLLLAKERKQIPSDLLSSRPRAVRLKVHLVDPASHRHPFTLVPETLLDAIWLQLADALSVNAEIHQCLQCEMWFPAGRGFGRRQDAKFCSAEHRILFNNQKRKEIV
jgi:hypothetical protein